MPLFKYSYTHDSGSGDGYREGDSAADVKEALEAEIRDGETKKDKVTSLRVSVSEVEQ